MATLDIAGQKVTVGDEFLKLSPEKQNDMVMEIASSLGIKPGGETGVVQKAFGLGKAAGTGVAKGIADVAGLPGDLAGAAASIADWLAAKAGRAPVSDAAGRILPEALARAMPGGLAATAAYQLAGKVLPAETMEAINPLRGSEVANRVVQQVTGPYREAEPGAEQYVETAARFVPGALMGPGGVVRNALTFGVIPGLASETAGQVFKGSAVEPYARAGAGVIAGGAGALAQRAGSAERLLSNSVKDVTPQQLDQMEVLFQQARREGAPISRAEALQFVTNGGTKIGDLQHTIEGMGGMKEFYAQRPAQNAAAAGRTFDEIAPRSVDPSQVGPAAGQAAENIVTRIRGAINEYTRPMYEAGGRHLVPERVHAAMMDDPLFAQTAATIRNDPARNALVQNASDRSVRFYDAVAKELEQRSRNAAQPLNPQASQAIASVTGTMGGDVKDIATAAERAATGGPSAYEAARATQARLRERFLQPVLNGPIGKLAGQDTSTKAAIEALFPANPLPGSQDEIAQTVRALSRQRPGVANDLVRAHAEMTFSEAAQRLASGGANQSGGAKFAATLRGNAEQAANLEAAVRALPNGDRVWQGFNRLLEVMEAQQYRQATGSRTAFKIPGVEDLKGGGVANNVAQVVGGGGLPLSKKVTTAIQNWNLGRNLDSLAELLTSPEAAQRFRELARLPSGSTQFGAVINRLGHLTRDGWRPKDGASDE